MQRLSLKLLKILVCCFNYSCRHTNGDRIIRNVTRNNSPCSNHNFIAKRNTRQNNDIISKIHIVPNFNRLCYFQVWNLVPKQQCTSIMRYKFYAVCDMNIFSKRNDPRFSVPRYTSIYVTIPPHIYTNLSCIFYGILSANNYPVYRSI